MGWAKILHDYHFFSFSWSSPLPAPHPFDLLLVPWPPLSPKQQHLRGKMCCAKRGGPNYKRSGAGGDGATRSDKGNRPSRGEMHQNAEKEVRERGDEANCLAGLLLPQDAGIRLQNRNSLKRDWPGLPSAFERVRHNDDSDSFYATVDRVCFVSFIIFGLEIGGRVESIRERSRCCVTPGK